MTGLRVPYTCVIVVLNMLLCSSLDMQPSITQRTYVGSELDSTPFKIARHFNRSSFNINGAAVCLGKILAHLGVLFVGR